MLNPQIEEDYMAKEKKCAPPAWSPQLSAAPAQNALLRERRTGPSRRRLLAGVQQPCEEWRQQRFEEERSDVQGHLKAQGCATTRHSTKAGLRAWLQMSRSRSEAPTKTAVTESESSINSWACVRIPFPYASISTCSAVVQLS